MTLLSLNDDVLLLIFSLLQGQDALHTCLACKRAYILAVPRLASSIQCWTPARLRQICDYYLPSDPFTGTPRVKYLETLTIHATTFEPERFASDSHELNTDDVDDLDLELVGTDFAQAHLLGDLLVAAHNIRELSLDRFHSLVRNEPRVSLAFSAMNQLAHVRLAMIGDGTLDALQHLQNPKRLTLSYHTPHDDPLDEPKSLPPLLTALAAFPNLHTLKLWNFTPPHPDDAVALPQLPSINYLRLSQSSVPALDMVQLCPNLSTLVFSVEREEGDVSGTLGIEDTREDGDAASQFLELLRVASPVGLYASLRVETGGFSARFWKDVCACAPRLRSLELKLSYSAVRRDGDGDDWLGGLEQGCLLANALRHIHGLVLLKILIPQAVPLLTITIPGMEDDMLNAQARSATQWREMERVRAVAALPQPLVDAIPSLRYLAVADMSPNPAIVEDAAHDGSGSSETDGGVYEWDEMREVEGIGKQMWWKVVEEDGKRVLKETSEDEGDFSARWLPQAHRHRAHNDINEFATKHYTDPASAFAHTIGTSSTYSHHFSTTSSSSRRMSNLPYARASATHATTTHAGVPPGQKHRADAANTSMSPRRNISIRE
uniref:Endochitinase 2 ) n=1 Tax=Ganoderma boninense TaxID=34458 RepID=A0A5K1K316_9APHY|nr:Endochitinase 2 (EC (Chitinase 2) [Ganoderma boninense]